MEDMNETISLENFRENADEVLETLCDRVGPLVLTTNGERMAVLIEYGTYEKQQADALRMILHLSQQEVRKGKTYPAGEVFAEVYQRILDGTCGIESD